MPNAADDPFGAMNHMAAAGQVHRAPEIVIVNDGKPVENVGSSGTGAKVAKIALPIVVALAAGLGIGRISKDANFYNDGLKDAKALLGDDKAPSTVKATKKVVADLERVLDEMNTKTKYRPDPGFEKQLAAIALKLEVNSALVYRAKQNALDPVLSGQVIAFYSGVAEVKNMLDTHAKLSAGDVQFLATGKQKADANTMKETENAALANQPKYAILVSAPSSDKDSKDANAEFGAKLVELGPPFCNKKESKNGTGKCAEGEEMTGFGYRTEPSALFLEGQPAGGGQDSVPAKKLLTLLPNGIRDSLIKGGEATASELYYVKRLTEVAKRTKKLLDEANKLGERLSAEANKGSRFSFFL